MNNSPLGKYKSISPLSHENQDNGFLFEQVEDTGLVNEGTGASAEANAATSTNDVLNPKPTSNNPKPKENNEAFSPPTPTGNPNQNDFIQTNDLGGAASTYSDIIDNSSVTNDSSSSIEKNINKLQQGYSGGFKKKGKINMKNGY